MLLAARMLDRLPQGNHTFTTEEIAFNHRFGPFGSLELVTPGFFVQFQRRITEATKESGTANVRFREIVLF